MEIQSLKVNEKLNISGMTVSGLLQSIANLSRQNTFGQYNDRIEAYKKALEQYKSASVAVNVHIPAPEEMAAIMLFNKDKRFTITE